MSIITLLVQRTQNDCDNLAYWHESDPTEIDIINGISIRRFTRRRISVIKSSIETHAFIIA